LAIAVEIPGRGSLRLEHVVFDVNGTLTNRGAVIDGVAERLAELRERVDVHLLSADTFGALQAVAGELGVRAQAITDGQEKAQAVRALGPERCAAIGNGANDASMLEAAALGIAVIGPEGASSRALLAADVLCASIVSALDLLLDARALVATLRS
jgi:P-type E1-E2 ATPase